MSMQTATVSFDGETYCFAGTAVEKATLLQRIKDIPDLQTVSINQCIVTPGLLKELAMQGKGSVTVRMGHAEVDPWDDVFLPTERCPVRGRQRRGGQLLLGEIPNNIPTQKLMERGPNNMSKKSKAREIYQEVANKIGIPAPTDLIAAKKDASACLLKQLNMVNDAVLTRFNEDGVTAREAEDACAHHLRSLGWEIVPNEDGNGFSIRPAVDSLKRSMARVTKKSRH